MDDLFEPVWEKLNGGETVSVVLTDVIWGTNTVMGKAVPSKQVVQVGGNMPTFMRVRFVSVSGLVVLSLDSLSNVLPHRPVLRDDCCNYVELCAGMCASSFGFCQVGFRHRCSVEWQSALVDLHRRIHPSVPVIHADICDCDTACEVHAVRPE